MLAYIAGRRELKSCGFQAWMDLAFSLLFMSGCFSHSFLWQMSFFMLQTCSILVSHSRGKTALSQSSIYISCLRKGLSFSQHGLWACSLDQVQYLGDTVMAGSHAHLCEGKEWLEVLPESNRMRKWKLSQRKEVGIRCLLYQKNEGREAGQKNIPGASPHPYCLILRHSELMENTKNYIHRYTLPRTLLFPKVLTSH